MRNGHKLALCAVVLALFGLGTGWVAAQEAAYIRYGLTQDRWDRYETLARKAVTNAVIWKKFSKRLPPGLKITVGAKTSGSTDSADGQQPPTEVEIHVPIDPITVGANRPTHVVVKFRHPSEEITGITFALIVH